MNFLIAATIYVVNDPYFLPSMALTVMIAMFVGALIYNGDLREIKKGLIAIAAYAFLVASTSAWRILPRLDEFDTMTNTYMPMASIVTLLFVTLFYLIGMFIGVVIIKKAHKV